MLAGMNWLSWDWSDFALVLFLLVGLFWFSLTRSWDRNHK